MELAYVDGADALDPGDAGAGAERFVGDVDEQASAAAELRELASGKGAQPIDGVAHVVGCPRGLLTI